EAGAWSATRPFKAEVLANQRITADGSSKDVRHLEIDLSGAGFDHEPGDALGVVPRNPGPLVDAVLHALHLDGEAAVTHADATHPLREWLTSKRELTRMGRPFVAALAERSGDESLCSILQPGNIEALRALLISYQPIDLLQLRFGMDRRSAGRGVAAAGAAAVLDRIQPRRGRRRSASH